MGCFLKSYRKDHLLLFNFEDLLVMLKRINSIQRDILNLATQDVFYIIMAVIAVINNLSDLQCSKQSPIQQQLQRPGS